MNNTSARDESVQQRGIANASGKGAVSFSPPAYFSTAGNNAAVQREGEENVSEELTETETTEMLPEQDYSDDGTPDPGDADENYYKPDFITKQEIPIELFNQTHHIIYKQQGEEIVPGIASDWTDVDTIYQEMRREGLLGGTTLTAKHSAVRSKNRLLASYIRELSSIDDEVMADERQHRRTGNPRDRELTQKRRKKANLRDMVKNSLDAAIRDFIHEAVLVNSTIVAEVLGARMPAIVHVTDVTNATAANTYRYHTGAAGDPIPLTWYKPANQYNAINVNDYANPAAPVNVALNPAGGNAAVTTPNGNAYTFGVAAGNFAMGQTWRNVARHGSDRAEQKRLNRVLASLDYDLGGNNEDGDHVRDLGFGGADQIDNYWPLDSTVNRLAFTGWRNQYNLNYKKSQQGNGDWNLEKAPLNSGTLVGKYFTITAENAVANPQNDENSGSDTGWGAAGTVLADDGTQIAEA